MISLLSLLVVLLVVMLVVFVVVVVVVVCMPRYSSQIVGLSSLIGPTDDVNLPV